MAEAKGLGATVMSGIAGGLPGMILGGVSSLLGGIGQKKREQRQLEQQQKLNAQAAELNYQYGEKAAFNAHKRQTEMYERTLADQSPLAQRQRLEEAGMNPALMYGGGAGGGAGVVASAPQAQTGGAQPGQADSPVQRGMLAGDRIRTGLQMAQMQANVKLTEAQARELETRADKTAGVDTQEAESRIGLNIANTGVAEVDRELKIAQRGFTELQQTIADERREVTLSTMYEQLDELRWDVQNAKVAYRRAWRANELEEEVYKTNVAQIEQNYRNSVVEGFVKGIQGQALQAGIRLTDAQVAEIRTLLPLKGGQMGQGISESEAREALTEIQTKMAEWGYDNRKADRALGITGRTEGDITNQFSKLIGAFQTAK